MNILNHLIELHARNTAIKEALDSLPTAVCYFARSGSVKLCNTAMHEVYRMLAGRDLQSREELIEAMNSCAGAGTGRVTRDGNIFLFPDGCARQYSEREIRTENGRVYVEAVFGDVTGLLEKRRELERQSDELKKMYTELKTLSGRLLEITREQEILNMKARLHDQMNMGIASIRQILGQNATSEEDAAAVARFRRAIQILQEESGSPADDLSEFISDAKVIGVRVNIMGELPEEKETSELVIAILREACVNAARHADATDLNIKSERSDGDIVLRITNDGRKPGEEVTPRGGLRNLKKRVEGAGGSLTVRSFPEFILEVTLPAQGGRRDRRS